MTRLPGTMPLEPPVAPALEATGHYHTERAGIIRLTDTAVTFTLGDSFASFPYSQIDAVSGGKGFIWGAITLYVGGRRHHLNWIEPADRVPAMIEHISERIGRQS